MFFLICLISRLLVAMPGIKDSEKYFFRNDSSSYISPAKSLCLTGTYSEVLRPPGYPFFLAVLFKIFGMDTQNYKYHVIIFCFLGAIILFPIYYLARLWGGRICGFFAAFCYIFNVTALSAAPLYLSDTLFTLFVAIQLWYFSRFYFFKRNLDLLISSVFLGMGILTRSMLFYWIIPFIFLVLFYSNISFGKRIKYLIVNCLIILIMVLPWMIRNYTLGAGFRIETNSANILYYNGAALESIITKVPAPIIRAKMIEENENDFKNNPQKYYNEDLKFKYKIQKLKVLISSHPFIYMALCFNPLTLLPDVPTFFELTGFTQTGRGTLDILHRQGIKAAVNHYFKGKIYIFVYVIPFLIFSLLAYLGCFLELIKWIYHKKVYLIMLFLSFIYYFIFLPGPMYIPRYQLPALPFIFVMAGKFYLDIINKYKKYQT